MSLASRIIGLAMVVWLTGGLSVARAARSLASDSGSDPGSDAYSVSPKSKNTERKKSKYGHFFVSATYNFADQINYVGSTLVAGKPTGYTAVDIRSAAAGLSGGYRYLKPWSFGFDGVLVYELPRTSQGIVGQAGAFKINATWSDPPSSSMALAAANANYSFGSTIYVFGGLNYPLILTTSSYASLTALPGYQAGVGARVYKNWSTDLSYRSVHFKGQFTNGATVLQVDQADLSGVVIGLNYSF